MIRRAPPGQLHTPQGTIDVSLDMVQEGSDLTGTWHGMQGDREFTGTIEDNHLDFSFTVDTPQER